MRSAKELAAGAAETPIRDHVARFWHLLATETVRLHLDLRRDRGDGIVYWDGASFSEDVARAIHEERQAADYIERTAAPADLALETTAEERRDVRVRWKGCPYDAAWTLALLRDHDTLAAALAAANERAASEKKRADDATAAIMAHRKTATERIASLAAERDREAAARREAEARRDEASRQRDEYLNRAADNEARAEQAEAERAALRAALVLARNRLQRAAVDHPTGTEPFYRVSEWADEASDVLASETKWADDAEAERASFSDLWLNASDSLDRTSRALAEAEAREATLRAAGAAVVSAADEFRQGMGGDWEGDPLSDACEALVAALATNSTVEGG